MNGEKKMKERIDARANKKKHIRLKRITLWVSRSWCGKENEGDERDEDGKEIM